MPNTGDENTVFAEDAVEGYSEAEQTQKEVTEKYHETVDNVLNGKEPPSGAAIIGYTPSLFQKMGMPSIPLTIGKGHIYSIAKTEAEAKAENRYRRGTNYHGLGETTVKNIMEYIEDPVMIIAAKDVDQRKPMRSTHSVVVITNTGTTKKPLIVPIELTAERYVNGERLDVNVASSIYEKNTAALVKEAIARFNTGEKSVFYVKKEATNLLGEGVQFPNQLEAAASYGGIVTNFAEKVNRSVENIL